MVKLNERVGAWRSPVAYSLGVRVVGRSNRLAPTILSRVSHTGVHAGGAPPA